MDCESACVDALQTAFLNAVDSHTSNSLSITLYTNHFLNFSFVSLIDCGSSHCFMDEKFAKDNCFPIILISPMRLKLIDGSYGPPLMRASDVTVTLSCGLVHNIHFLITHLDHEFSAVLGLDWLTQHNPLIKGYEQCNILKLPMFFSRIQRGLCSLTCHGQHLVSF